MSTRATSHPLSVIIPAGTPQYLVDGTQTYGTFAADTPCTLYRRKSGGRWDAKAQCSHLQVGHIVVEGYPRRIYVYWKDCRKVVEAAS